MLKIIAGCVLIVFSLFIFLAFVNSYEIEKASSITTNLLFLKAPPNIDQLNAKIMYSRAAGYTVAAVGTVYVIWGIWSLYQRRKSRLPA